MKTVGQARVCTYLLGIRPAEVKEPLGKFQATEATKKDTLQMVSTLNEGLDDRALAESQLAKTFERWWPDLQTTLESISVDHPSKGTARPSIDILEQILLTLRTQSNRMATLPQELVEQIRLLLMQPHIMGLGVPFGPITVNGRIVDPTLLSN